MAASRKKLLFFLLLLVMIGAANQFTFIQAATARITSTLYVQLKYNQMDFTFAKVEFVPQFGDYLVTYRDKNDKYYSFTVIPKFLPVLISYAPLNPGP